MNQLRIGISTQTPLVRMGGEAHHGASGQGVQGRPVPLREGGFDLSPGGVSRMVLQMVRQWHASGWMRQGHLFSLQPKGPERLRLEELGLDVHHLRLPEAEMQAYARTKEKLWSDIHGLEAPRFDTEDFRFYARYNWSTGDAILAQAPDLDAVYVHDFQLLQVGAILGLAAPSVLRWHVPFDPVRMPRYTRHVVLRLMEDFDGVVVSTRRDLQGLTNAGFRGKVLQQYPHTDLQDWPEPAAAAVAEFEALARLPSDAAVVLCVARMDPIKRQDVLLQAMAHLRHRHPGACVVLVGNGSFSGSASTGLGLSKAHQWRAYLEGLAKELKVEEHVRFMGWLPDRLVTAAYQRATALVLPPASRASASPLRGWPTASPPPSAPSAARRRSSRTASTASRSRPETPRPGRPARPSPVAPEEAARMGETGNGPCRGTQCSRRRPSSPASSSRPSSAREGQDDGRRALRLPSERRGTGEAGVGGMRGLAGADLRGALRGGGPEQLLLDGPGPGDEVAHALQRLLALAGVQALDGLAGVGAQGLRRGVGQVEADVHVRTQDERERVDGGLLAVL
ncbi:MAG TPA: glycosyltransferase, partial [Candidatus Thermoplasmatota archaeon]|nr:glycosyltransferase [Candidatus Thermoplasmatota archaeon]